MTDPTTPSATRHRGRHPADEKLFSVRYLATLQRATAELSWLFQRGYSHVSALKLVGDRHELRKRQRKAVLRSACASSERKGRGQRRVEAAALSGQELWLDGFNCVITIEAALSGGVILCGADGAHRDLSSVHGSYRRVAETERAVTCIARLLQQSEVARVRWLLDKPVSNSGRLATILRAAAPAGIDWQVELVFNPDKDLCQPASALAERVVASSDAWVLDHCDRWFDIPGAVIERWVPDAWVLAMGADMDTAMDTAMDAARDAD